MRWLAASVVLMSLLSGSFLSASAEGAGLEVRNETVSWLFQHEQRGLSLAQANIPLRSLNGSRWQPVRFARVLQPDPSRRARIALSLIGKRGRNVCMTVFLGKASSFGGCAVGSNLRPLTATTAGHVAGLATDAVVVAGVAGDNVVRVELIDATGGVHPVALKDNTFLVQVAGAVVPSKLLSFDRRGHRIGTTRI